MNDWIAALAQLAATGRNAVLVSIVATKGSVPRVPGTRMIVTSDAMVGTIGGGHLEFKAIGIARGLLADGGPRALHRFPLGASLGQCCGGLVQLLFEPIAGGAAWPEAMTRLRANGADFARVTPVRGDDITRQLMVTATAATGTLGSVAADGEAVTMARSALDGDGASRLATLGAGGGLEVFIDLVRVPDFAIVLFGAGHVGRALVCALGGVDCRIRWVDSRDDAFPAAIPENVECVLTDTPEAEVAAAAAGAYFLVMTHSHALDEKLSEHILARADFAYFGLIGSASKRRQFERRLEARGTPRSRFAAMTCPIGIAGIGGKEPAVIAIAVAAELLQVQGRMAAAGTVMNRCHG